MKPVSLGSTFVFRIDRCSVYTGKMNKDFCKFWLIQDSVLFRVKLRQVSLYIYNVDLSINIFIRTSSCRKSYKTLCHNHLMVTGRAIKPCLQNYTTKRQILQYFSDNIFHHIHTIISK